MGEHKFLNLFQNNLAPNKIDLNEMQRWNVWESAHAYVDSFSGLTFIDWQSAKPTFLFHHEIFGGMD